MPEVGGPFVSAETELRTLCSRLHLDAPVVCRFIGDYLRLLQFRLDRIDRDLATGDIPAAIIGLLSLSASSSMLGAVEVADAAEEVRRCAAAGDPAAVAESRSRLLAQARRAGDRLTQIEHAGAEPGLRP